jgi:hypothetical protein
MSSRMRFGDPVGVGEQRAELLVEGLEDVAQPVQLGLGLVAAAVGRHRLDLRVLVGQRDLHRRLLLDAVAVHVDGFEDALGEVLLLRRRQLGRQQVEEDRELLPLGVAVGNHRREEIVGAAEHLGLALEVHLAVLVEPLHIDRHAGIEDRVELVAVRAAEETAPPPAAPARANTPARHPAPPSGRAACWGRSPRRAAWCGSSPGRRR